MYHIFIQSSVDGLLGCFHVLALLSAAVNIGLHLCVCVCVCVCMCVCLFRAAPGALEVPRLGVELEPQQCRTRAGSVNYITAHGNARFLTH